MAVIIIKKSDFTQVRALLMGSPFEAIERPIAYGVQFKLPCGINCNVHYSDKNTEIMKITPQNEQLDLELFQLLEFNLSTFAC
ncbi:hypothetical protein [Photobacterium leiognathi]|uniref:Uncharacterized protein n=1 Tax=Photobacterium leiognathi TaxID=553611 RepID=A0A2T3M7L4_PHOLE|nr:hypothetical protein [Photobacterium leiognathi]PSV88261.1 hypothetical protein CTM89_14890 [Photobacterium leiognathi]